MSVEIEGHIIPVVNTYASNFARAWRAFDSVKEQYPRQIGATILTSANSAETVERIMEQSGEADLLVVIGGDKTTADAGLAASKSRSVVLPFWGGNGNDASRDLYGSRQALSGSQLLRDSHLCDVSMLGVQKNDEPLIHGLNYASVGITGDLAKALNGVLRSVPGYRSRALRPLYEVANLAPRLAVSRPFHLEEKSSGGAWNTPDRQVERTFNNASRMAKYFRMPFSLIEPTASVRKIRTMQEFFSSAYTALVSVAPYDERIDQGMHHHIRISDGHPLLQADGDVLSALHPGDEVVFSVTSRSFRAITTRPPQQK